MSDTPGIEVEPDPADKPETGQPITDLLVNMFLRQLAHKQDYDEIYRAKGLNPVPPGEWGNLNSPQLQLEMRTTLTYFFEEVFEAVNKLKNKPWKQTARSTDPDEFYTELADAWHFWLEFLILAGMSPDRAQKYYFTVADSNDNRRAEGY